MSHETEAESALFEAIMGSLMLIAEPVRYLLAEQEKIPEASNHFVAMQQSAVSVIMACDALQLAAKGAEAQCRVALATAMALGSTTVRTADFTVSLRAAAQRVLITDEAAIPARYMVQPPPKPDLVAISALLRGGKVIPGVSLTNGGADIVSIRTRKQG